MGKGVLLGKTTRRVDLARAPTEHRVHGAVVLTKAHDAGAQVFILVRQGPVEYVTARAGGQYVEVEPDRAPVTLAEGVDGVDFAGVVGGLP